VEVTKTPELRKIQKLVLDYLNAYPTATTAKLAGMIVEDHPGVGTKSRFMNAINYRRGTAGGTKRKTIKMSERSAIIHSFLRRFPALSLPRISELIFSNHPNQFKDLNDVVSKTVRERTRAFHGGEMPAFKRVHVPPGLRQGQPDLCITGARRMLLLSDLHVPFHDEQAIAAAVEEGVRQGCDSLYINGDAIDFYMLSRFRKDPGMPTSPEEVDLLKTILCTIGEPFVERWYKSGNHEDRLEYYLWTNAPQLSHFPCMELPAVLGLAELGFTHVKSKQVAHVGDVVVVHGHECNVNSGVNPAKSLYTRLGASAVCGHVHTCSTHHEMSPITRKSVHTRSCGCLCDLRPEYHPINRWMHGAAIIEVTASGHSSMRGFRIEDGVVTYV